MASVRAERGSRTIARHCCSSPWSPIAISTAFGSPVPFLRRGNLASPPTIRYHPNHRGYRAEDNASRQGTSMSRSLEFPLWRKSPSKNLRRSAAWEHLNETEVERLIRATTGKSARYGITIRG